MFSCKRILHATAVAFCSTAYVRGYEIVRDYSGSTFFDGWDFYGNYDNLTNGDVWWLGRDDAFGQGLAYTDEAGRAVIKVDNSSEVAYNDKRNSVRIASQDSYELGSLWVIDLTHIPFGCSVWPSFWTQGASWPDGGEIDIIEAINLMPYNQAALHSSEGCAKADAPNQSGFTGETDCTQSTGCTVLETKENSLGSGFADSGGGVWAVQFDVAGIFMWFWGRPDVPAAITYANASSPLEDLTQFGNPYASFPASGCDIGQHFTAQNLVLDITLCGGWAGIEELYAPSCASEGSTGTCYPDNVVGPGSPKYDDAYFEVSYIRAYTTGGTAPSPTAAPLDVAPTSPASTVLMTSTGNPTPTSWSDEDGDGADAEVGLGSNWLAVLVAGVSAVSFLWM